MPRKYVPKKDPKYLVFTKEVDGVEKRFRKAYLKSGVIDSPVCAFISPLNPEKLCNMNANKVSGLCYLHNPIELLKIEMKRGEKLRLKDGANLSAHDFVFKLCKTLDPHDKKHPIKPFPDLPYLHKMVDLWLEHQLILVVKSRQMMASWLYTALHLWDAAYHEGRSIFFISKKEEDAGFGNQLSLLSRARFMLEQIPESYRPKFKTDKRPPKIEFIGKYSSIMACSQEAEALRQYTASRIMSDEMAFQDQAERAYVAMKPTLDGGGQFTGISTPNGRMNLFYHLVNDVRKTDKKDNSPQMETSHLTNLRQESVGTGLWTRQNRNAFFVVGLHRSANPKRGDDWAKEAKKSYISDDAWRQEQELDFSKTEGARVYPSFKVDKHVKKLSYNPYRTIWRGWDFGYVHPAVVFAQLDENDRLCILKECMGDEVTINEFAKHILKMSSELFPGMTFKDAGDPAGRARTDKSEKTTVDILRGMGIKMHMQSSGVEEGINCIRGMMINRADDLPGIFMDPSCEILMDGMLGGYIRKDNGDMIKDGYYEHLMDALRYLVVVLYDVRTFRPYRTAKVYIPKHAIIDPVSGF